MWPIRILFISDYAVKFMLCPILLRMRVKSSVVRIVSIFILVLNLRERLTGVLLKMSSSWYGMVGTNIPCKFWGELF